MVLLHVLGSQAIVGSGEFRGPSRLLLSGRDRLGARGRRASESEKWHRLGFGVWPLVRFRVWGLGFRVTGTVNSRMVSILYRAANT